jgi:hypothetical protein
VYNNNTTLKVQFFWQKKQKDTQTTMSLLTTPFSTKGLDQNEGAYPSITWLFDRRGERIKSSEFFELQSNSKTATKFQTT